jgi:maltose O-acetyltransferase|tara:strand:- start:5549 stop:6058 length:510 start_codon:yes stop_codon:yes gene_type:complete
MKKIIRVFSEFFIFRWISLLFLKISWAFSRVWSHLRFKALVPNSGDSVCHYSVEIKYGNNIIIGNKVAIGRNSSIGAKSKIIIGNNVTLSRGVIIETAGLDFSKAPPYKHFSFPITIKEGVWIGANSVILGGVVINEKAIIGSGAVVTKDVPAGAIIVGAKNRNLKLEK